MDSVLTLEIKRTAPPPNLPTPTMCTLFTRVTGLTGVLSGLHRTGGENGEVTPGERLGQGECETKMEGANVSVALCLGRKGLCVGHQWVPVGRMALKSEAGREPG